MPKANGYEALHSTVMGPDGVWVEVQIRTQRMEDIAERGFAAHWKYKHATISQDEDEFDKWLKQIRAALNSPTENAVDFLDNFKLSLYTSEIVVFTPKGESRKMPYGATALDFAYDIHSKIGNSAISAKINHKLEPITTQINSGDQIEIITADNARPKPEWLEVVTTAKAKQAIKNFLKRERQNNIEHGMQMLDEKMKSLNVQTQRPRPAQDRPHLRLQQQGGAVLQDRAPESYPSTISTKPSKSTPKAKSSSSGPCSSPKRRRRPTIRPRVRLPRRQMPRRNPSSKSPSAANPSPETRS